MEQTEFSVILNHFLPFQPPNNPENQNFEKMKKMPRYIIILNMCIINENTMMYSSWDMEHNRQNFFSFWTLFTPLTTQKTKILKRWKKHLEISSFYTSVPQMKIWGMVPEIWSTTENFLSFGAIFCPFTLLTTQKIKLLKKWKTSLDVSSFKCTKNHDHMLYCSWDMACDGFNC